MKFTVVIAAAFLAVFLAPALATQNGEENLQGHHGENSRHCDTEVSTNSKDFKTVWDIKTGYIATKVLSKNTCIIARMDRSSFLDGASSAPRQGAQRCHPRRLPHRHNTFSISRIRLPTLLPYGKSIEDLCRGIPSYFAYPLPGSNFFEQEVSCLKVKINELPIYYCD